MVVCFDKEYIFFSSAKLLLFFGIAYYMRVYLLFGATF